MLHGKTGVSWHASLFAARIYKQSGGIVDFFKQTMRFASLTPGPESGGAAAYGNRYGRRT